MSEDCLNILLLPDDVMLLLIRYLGLSKSDNTQFIKNSPISRILDPSLCQMASQYLFVYLEELFAEFCSKPWSPEKLRLARGSLQIPPNLSVCFLFCFLQAGIFPPHMLTTSVLNFHDFISQEKS